MTTLQSSSPLLPDPAGGAANAFAGAALFEGRSGGAESYPWMMAFAGVFAADLVARMFCTVPKLPSLSMSVVLFRSVEYVSMTVAAGVAGIWAYWYLNRLTVSVSPRPLAKNLAAGWVFLPAMALLYRQDSPWLFLVTAVAAAATALRLRSLFPAGVNAEASGFDYRRPDDLHSLEGLPAADAGSGRSVLIAVCAYAAIVCAVRELMFVGSILIAICGLLVVWRWSASDEVVVRRSGTISASAALYVAGIAVTCLAMLPWLGSRHALGSKNSATSGSPDGMNRPLDRAGLDYMGVVLLPPPVKKVKVIPPAPQEHTPAMGRMSEPVIIPFDGPYWYFKEPHTQPGANAHVAHGKATEVNVHSTDRLPLRMEAHQTLVKPIDLACCREIDVTITNADNRLGKIALELVLTDASAPGKPFQDLGGKSILSSEAPFILANRPSTKETLHFAIPKGGGIRRFSEITVVFLTAPERALGGAKVSVESFELIPR